MYASFDGFYSHRADRVRSSIWHNGCNVPFYRNAWFVFLGQLSESRLTHISTALFAWFTSLPTHQLKDPFPRSLRSATLELASNNLICSVALTGVLALQAGRWWAERADADDEEEEAHPETDAERRRRRRAEKSKLETKVRTSTRRKQATVKALG
jgi:hypothetical protein